MMVDGPFVSESNNPVASNVLRAVNLLGSYAFSLAWNTKNPSTGREEMHDILTGYIKDIRRTLDRVQEEVNKTYGSR